MIKKVFIILILTFVIFILGTLLTMKIETPFDGNDTYGFPFTFYVKWSMMCYECPKNPTKTYVEYLILDILIALFVGFGLYWIGRKIKTKRSEVNT